MLHPTSLPGPYGIGELGPAAYQWIDFLSETRTHLWQVLPLGPTGYGDSPYQCFSAFAGNPYLISFQELIESGLCRREWLAEIPDFSPDRVDYGLLIPWKLSILERVFDAFDDRQFPVVKQEFDQFRAIHQHWLPDFCLFMALKDHHRGEPWWGWAKGVRDRDPREIDRAREELEGEVRRHEFLQFLFFRQWLKLKAYAREHGVKIIGDIPIFVARDSADVWANPHLFHLDEKGSPTVVAGVPPDYFSPTGQLWGNPIYNWKAHEADNYRWWIERFESVLGMVDIIRLDHFRGFAAAWEVPAGEETAEKGKWVRGPGSAFFRRIEGALGHLPILAEDLGVITPDVVAIREEFKLPGMKVLVFAFDSGPVNPFLPHNHEPDSVIYTGTHDNDTVLGWYERIDEEERFFYHQYLGFSGKEPNWELIRTAWASVGVYAMAPAQDILGLDNQARMNYPSRPAGNWQWRMKAGALDQEIVRRLSELNQIYSRDRWDRDEVQEEDLY